MPLVKPEAEKEAPVGKGIQNHVLEDEWLRNLGMLGLGGKRTWWGGSMIGSLKIQGLLREREQIYFLVALQGRDRPTHGHYMETDSSSVEG